MNLLKDPWIPVQNEGGTALITLEQVLCTSDDYHIALPRDDLELACLQLMICLTQVLFPPEDRKALLARLRQPMSTDEYAQGIQPFIDWFDLRHEQWPFMQVRGVKAEKPTPIQKIFVGLPAGNNHSFFNKPCEIESVDPAIAAIAMFNMANNYSYGGGIKEGLRVLGQKSPITTLMNSDKIRYKVWVNILHKDSISKLYPDYKWNIGHDKPVWVDPIKPRSIVYAEEIGLLRGLFWQPAHIELKFGKPGHCGVLGINSGRNLVEGFFIEKFGSKKTGGYDNEGVWVHPHSPRVRDLKKNTLRYLSFTTTAPAWAQLNHLLVASQDQKEGHDPAEVVLQFKRDIARPSQLIVGGYRNKGGSILQRRHELFPLKAGWEKGDAIITKYVSLALEIKQVLTKSLWKFGQEAEEAKFNHEKPKHGKRGVTKKGIWAGIQNEGEALYYHQSEPLIHQTLREIDWSEAGATLDHLRDELIRLSWDIFDQVTRPYAHEPRMLQALATAKRSLGAEFKKLKGGSA